MEKYRGLFLILCGFMVGRLVGLFLFPSKEKIVIRRGGDTPIHYRGNHTEPGDWKAAEEESRQISVYCLVLTNSSRHAEILEPLTRPWIHRCTRSLVVSNVEDRNFSTVAGGQTETERLVTGINHVLDTGLDDYDWFLLTSDQTFVILENLRHFLTDKDPGEAAYWGEKYCLLHEDVYSLKLDVGIVLSREGLARLAESPAVGDCWSVSRDAGAVLETCLLAAGVPYQWSRDEEDKLCFSWMDPLNSVAENTTRVELSDSLIAFRLPYNASQSYELFVYHIKAFEQR